MEFLYRSANPAYKGFHAQPARPTGLLAELGAVLGGGVPTAYKTVTGVSAQAPTRGRSWWAAFAVTPSYKTAAPCAADDVAPGEPSLDGEDGAAGSTGECSDSAVQVVIL